MAATRSRLAKVAALADLLGRARDGGEDELTTVVSYLGGALRQRRTGLGWRGVADLPEPADEPTLTMLEVHAAFEALAAEQGPGSQARRASAVADLFGRADAAEQRWLRGLVTGELRQGALDTLVQDAAAKVAGLPPADVRRAAMLAGSTVTAGVTALTGGAEALARFVLTVGRPVLPMLASSAGDVTEAVTRLGGPVAVDTKLDGIRIQVHRNGSEVVVTTRTLDDVTARLPEVVAVVRSLPAETLVLDGEALALDEQGRPRAFQDTASRTAQSHGATITPFFFDCLHADGTDLLDAPLRERLEVLDRLVPERHRAPRLVTDDPVAAEEFAAGVLRAGHEGVVVKDLAAGYAAGRRGAAWIKVKPVHTLDLVVLAVEWGSGRRRGKLSNLHLGARDDRPGAPAPFVMLGKTFKGLTDELLAWQTERFLALRTHQEGHVVHVRPEQVVEIALDGLQRSTRYPGGVALRFARVLRYRDDKTADEADALGDVLRLGATPEGPEDTPPGD